MSYYLTETDSGVLIRRREHQPWTEALEAWLAAQHDDDTPPLLVIGSASGLVRIASRSMDRHPGRLSAREVAGVRGVLAAHAAEPLKRKPRR